MDNKLNIAIALFTVMAMAAVAIPSAMEPSDAAADAEIIGYGSTTGSIEYVLYSEGVQDHDDYGALVIKFRSAPSTQTMNVTVAGVAYPIPVPVQTTTKLAIPWTLDESTTAYTVAVTATGYSATCDLTVGTATMSPSSATITTGSTADLKIMVGSSEVEYGGTVTWATSNSSVATVSNGTVTAVAAGSATITATITKAYGTTVDETCSVTVSGPSPPGPGPGPGPSTTYTVTFAVDPTAGGSVSKTSVSGLSSGTAISASGSTVTIGSGTTAQTITATAASGYSFKEWKDIPSTGTITANVTVTAVFIEEVQPITKEVANGSVTIPASVVESAGIKDASKLILKIEKATPTASNIPSDAICYQVTLTYDGKALTKFSDYIDVLLKLPTGILSTGLKVYYVSDDGTTVENMNATYDAGTNSMFFKTKHLSVFAITKENIEPVPVLSSISVKTAPSKVSYTVGDKFDPTGLVLTLTYSDSSTATLEYKGNESKFSFSPDLETSLKSTDKTVTITYEGKTTTQSITVSESPSGGDDNSMMIIIIVIIVLLLIVAIAFFVMKMRIKP